MIEILTSDTGILLFSSLGLVATAITILRDARPQYRRPAAELGMISEKQHAPSESMELAA